MTCIHKQRTNTRRDLIGIGVFTCVVGSLAVALNGFERLLRFIDGKGDVDEIFTVLIFLPAALGVFAWRRWKESLVAVREKKQEQEFLESILRGLTVPICIINAAGHFVRWNSRFED